MSLQSASKLRVRQIGEADTQQVVDLLARGFPGRPREFWLRIMACLTKRPPFIGLPKYGYLLEADSIVGVILQIFSNQRSDYKSAIRCNVSSWYVEPHFRSYASLLVAKALSYPDVTYLNITPASNTLPMLEAQGYSQYSKGIFVAAPALQIRGKTDARVVKAAEHQASRDEQADHNLLMDHAEYGCISLWCETADRAYPFVFRPSVVKGVIPSAQLIYCHDVDDFVRFAGSVGRFLAYRGRPLVLVDSNGRIPGLIGKYLDAKMPKYFRGVDRPRLGDLAYTETAMFGI
jgi:hypothetical protein